MAIQDFTQEAHDFERSGISKIDVPESAPETNFAFRSEIHLFGKMPRQILRAAGISLIAMLLPMSSQAKSGDHSLPDTVLYRHATLIDGTGAPSRQDMDVLVAGERIRVVIPDSGLRPDIAGHARVVELGGKYLMPGLIDAHVHLATPPNRRQAEAILRRDLYGGVTAVRDMADDLRAVGELARASLVGEIPAPDIYYAALMAGPVFFSDKRTGLASAGTERGRVPWMQMVTDDTNLPLAIAQAKGTYATAVKLYADLSPSLVSKLTEEAHRQHMLVWAHATIFPAKPSEVVAAGVDTIAHACILPFEVRQTAATWADRHQHVPLEQFAEGNNPALARLFTDMVQRGTIMDPTIWAYSPSKISSTIGGQPVPAHLCDDVIAGAITSQAYRAGVQIAAGTDNNGDWTDRWPDLFHELSAMADKAHMPAGAIIHSATLVGARAAGQQREMGSIEPGKLANMVVLIKDPTADIHNLKTIVMTVKRGRTFERRHFLPLSKNDISDE